MTPIGGLRRAHHPADMAPLEEHALAPATARQAHDILASKKMTSGCSAATNPTAARMLRERNAPDAGAPNLALATTYKVVGVSGDHERPAKRCETEMQAALGPGRVSVAQPDLDITHPRPTGTAAPEHGGAESRDRGDRRQLTLATFARVTSPSPWATRQEEGALRY